MDKSFKKIIEEISRNGFYASFREWSIGKSVIVGLAPADTISEIKVVPRAFYISQIENGAWYTLLGGVDIDERYTLEEVINFAINVLKMSQSKYKNVIYERHKLFAKLEQSKRNQAALKLQR